MAFFGLRAYGSDGVDSSTLVLRSASVTELFGASTISVQSLTADTFFATSATFSSIFIENGLSADDLTLIGTLTTKNATVTDQLWATTVTVNEAFYALGDFNSFTKDVEIGGYLRTNQSGAFGSLVSSGNASFSSNLFVTGAQVSITKSIVIGESVDAGQAVTVRTGGLFVLASGNASVTGTVFGTYGSISEDLDVGGLLTATAASLTGEFHAMDASISQFLFVNSVSVENTGAEVGNDGLPLIDVTAARLFPHARATSVSDIPFTSLTAQTPSSTAGMFGDLLVDAVNGRAFVALGTNSIYEWRHLDPLTGYQHTAIRAAGNHSVTEYDDIVAVQTADAGAGVTLVLPPIEVFSLTGYRKRYTIVDEQGAANVNNITILAGSASTNVFDSITSDVQLVLSGSYNAVNLYSSPYAFSASGLDTAGRWCIG